MKLKLTYVDTSISYDVEVAAIKSNVIQVTGDKLVMKESGFTLVDEADNEYDYTAYSTLYRTVDKGFQYSNDGEVWVEPTKTVTVQVTWVDDENTKKTRPSSLKIEVFDNEESIGTVALNAKNSWTKTYENVPVSHEYTITAPEVDGYDREINGTYVNYSIQQAYEPTVDEQLSELTDMVVDLDERVYALEEA